MEMKIFQLKQWPFKALDPYKHLKSAWVKVKVQEERDKFQQETKNRKPLKEVERPQASRFSLVMVRRLFTLLRQWKTRIKHQFINEECNLENFLKRECNFSISESLNRLLSTKQVLSRLQNSLQNLKCQNVRHQPPSKLKNRFKMSKN